MRSNNSGVIETNVTKVAKSVRNLTLVTLTSGAWKAHLRSIAVPHSIVEMHNFIANVFFRLMQTVQVWALNRHLKIRSFRISSV